MTAPPQLVLLAKQSAARHNLDAALVCAIIEQESAWNPTALRYEALFFAKYVAPLYTNNKISATEAYARGFSWGLMQVMGQVARENAYTAPFLSQLCDPVDALEIGCRVLTKKLAAASNDVPRALQLWNGGNNAAYATQVLARKPHYQ
jgi:soluble lytic murein transglycosylase-like protein